MRVPVTYRPNATDADNSGVARAAAVYVQDQMGLTSRLDAVVGRLAAVGLRPRAHVPGHGVCFYGQYGVAALVSYAWMPLSTWTVSPRLHAQLNVENLFDSTYCATANNNSTITPGAPAVA